MVKSAEAVDPRITKLVAQFVKSFQPLERKPLILRDNRTGAHFCECHIRGSILVQFGTPDVPLDPDDQPEYRANRQLVTNAPAFEKMKDDASQRRTFSNIVAEYTTEFDESRPLKIIGGQHRFQAIREAMDSNIDEVHGVKTYFGLDKDQRLDVQLISNTSIAISGDLFDRMQETVRGPQLREWCQLVGLLEKGQDFADKRARGGPISVQIARTFILNYFAGKDVDCTKFSESQTSPMICATGEAAAEWEALLKRNPKLYQDKGLKLAGEQFLRLVRAQRNAFKSSKKAKPDFPEKSMNLALLAAWAYIAGVLHNNEKRLTRHYQLADTKGGDPLIASALAQARHKSDPDNYRGLGYRTDAKERGRFAELFFIQAERGEGLSKPMIELAIGKFHAKEAMLEVQRIEAKAG